MDANIIGIGLGDIFSAHLSKQINKIKVSGKPTNQILDLSGKYKASDICVNRATELWVAFQQLIITGQIRGLDESIIAQLCDMPAEHLNGKMKVMDKKKFRAEFGYSPDRAETCLFIIDLIRTRGIHSQSVTQWGSRGADIGRLGFKNNREGLITRPEDLFVNMAPCPYTEQPEYGGYGGSSGHLEELRSLFGQDNGVMRESEDDGLENVIHQVYKVWG